MTQPSPLRSTDVRERYLRFFEERGHRRLPSDSLVPANDPTLLFTGAGMNQFKEMFLGKGSLPWKRVTTAQKCLRVPDLENVGRTPRHHTFFEMLGNFSFGDYFKKECIRWEWDFFTEALGMPKDRLWATIYLDDDEAFAIWRDDVGLPVERIYRFGEKENFWPAEAPSKGPNGPCGPCSEIYFDQRPGEAPPPPKGLKAMPDDRFLEVGNCVFTQFDRRDAASGKGGDLRPLPQKNIDVGLGLERIVAVLQGAPNNFETDLFRPYLAELERLSKRRYATDSADGIRMRRIADHVRAVTFCIADGARPSNEGRGYVVRKILRRASRDLYDLGITEPALYGMVPIVGSIMGEAYPEVRNALPAIATFLRGEEERFREVYVRGTGRLEELFEEHKANKTLAGEAAFVLHDTLGFPIDLIEQIAEERGFRVDQAGFERAMEEQRGRARAGSSISKEIFVEGPDVELRQRRVAPSVFTGYADTEEAYRSPSRLEVRGAIVVGLRAQGAVKEVRFGAKGGAIPAGAAQVAPGERFLVVLDRTPFYAEGGGQVGDVGTLTFVSRSADDHPVVRVAETRRVGDYVFHHCEAQPTSRGSVHLGDDVDALVDAEARLATERHHTATHLLHLALRKILGNHVNQAGSLVDPERLRFDFTHGAKLAPEQIRSIEDFVNERILRASPVSKREMAIDEAQRAGAMMLFGEKYGERVRVLEAADSVELCGGTHVGNTGNIGSFRIVSEASAAAGIRRIEAVCGPLVQREARAKEELLDEIARELKSPGNAVLDRLRQLKGELKQAKESKAKSAGMDRKAALAKVRETLVPAKDGVVAAVALPGFPGTDLKALVDDLKRDTPDFAVALLAPEETQVSFVVAIHGAPAKRLRAGDVAKAMGPAVAGGGGGRPDFAQGQGKNPAGAEEAAGVASALLRG